MDGGSSAEGGGEKLPPPTPQDQPSSSSALTQPLLSKPFHSPDFPLIEDYEPRHHPAAAPSDDESAQYPPISFHRGPRTCRDLPFLALFLLFSAATFAFGIYAVAHRNPNFPRLSSFSYDSNSTSCVRLSADSAAQGPWVVRLEQPLYDSSESAHLVKNLVWTLAITLVVSFPMALAILWLLKHFTKHVVYACLPFFVLIPAFFNVYWFVVCTLGEACREAFPLAYRILVLVFVFLLIGILIWIIVANWHRVELTIRIVHVAAHALSHNMGLLAMLPSMTLGLVIYFVPLVVFLVFARWNGKIVPREQSDGEYQCAWKQDRWVPAYYTLGFLTMLWSVSMMVEAQVYVISGTIAQWYFSKEGEKPRRSMRNSLRNAFGSSFGTVCFSGLIMAAIRVVRAIVDSAKQEDRGTGIIKMVLRCCTNICLASFDFVNKFTIIFAAITGEGYCLSAMMTYELLKRNLLSAVFVETVSTRILIGIVFVLSATYAIVVCAILKAVSSLGAFSYLVAVCALLLLLLVLGFFVHVLDNVIDTVYVCYAIDRDKGEVCKQEVHEVYVLLPISRNDRPSLATRSPLLSTIICIDNSEWMRNGDYAPSRFQAQADAVNLICGAKTQAGPGCAQSNPENTVGILTMGGKGVRVLVTPTSDLGKILGSFHALKGGKKEVGKGKSIE
ncbi:hypothetical protein Taro_025607 [Colocasia esculenta]|uniref:Choline transporter-like protein n=1 Tax=Colocasia esculenta TaxID=4460 RepID=A0A843VEQ4_COLES|nr:hypothetical protein [Colocasia esculenta]